MGYPFTEDDPELFAIHTKDVMDVAVVNSVQTVSKIGEELFKIFAKERFDERSKFITDPLKKRTYLHSSLKAGRSFQKTKPKQKF